MQNPAPEILQLIKDKLIDECPLSVLEISGYDEMFGKLILDYPTSVPQSDLSQKTLIVDRVDLSDGVISIADNIYDCVYSSDYLLNTDSMNEYDLIIVFHLFENMIDTEAKSLLISLLTKVVRQVLVITPVYSYDLSADEGFSKIRSYHPIFFLGMDFSYSCIENTDPVMQYYSFFPKIVYQKLPCDFLPKTIKATDYPRKLKIAYVLPNQHLTGCIKSMLYQMKEMTLRGHTVIAYFQSDDATSAIPEWSNFKGDDFSGQIVFPKSADPAEYIVDADIVFLGWMQQVPKFRNFNIPVVLWEQGSEYIFGDYLGKKEYELNFRSQMQLIYRMPVHLLSVSETIRTALRERYNRESQLFPLAIDTDLYYPLEQKNNEVPIILLVGNPILKFKGILDYAFPILHMAGQAGLKFKVWWASQTKVEGLHDSDALEMFILPTQEQLAGLFRKADILLSTSLYESFSLPPLEAMASGTAVIATDNGGINSYAKPGVNCILCDQGDKESVVAALDYLINNPTVRNLLAVEGRKTALEYSFSNVVPKLEQCLYNILATENQ